MSYANNQFQFWDFVRSMDRTGDGVDYAHFGCPPPLPPHTSEGPSGHPHHSFEGSASPNYFPGSFVFGGPGPFGPQAAFYSGRGGHRSRRGCPGMWGRDASAEPPAGDSDDNDAVRAVPGHDGPDAPEGTGGAAPNNNAEGAEGTGPQRPHGPHNHGPHSHGRGGPQRWGRGGWGRHGGHRGFPFSPDETFDVSALIESLSSHPIAQAIRSYAEQYATQAGASDPGSGDANAFVPPVDIFVTPGAFTLHVALPGAKKEDVGVNWDPEKGELSIAGVVYRPGDEAFISGLRRGERKVGLFERSVKLPLAAAAAGGQEGEKGKEREEEIDGDNITAKLEDGVLVITVPTVEKEWTDVKKVDIST